MAILPPNLVSGISRPLQCVPGDRSVVDQHCVVGTHPEFVHISPECTTFHTPPADPESFHISGRMPALRGFERYWSGIEEAARGYSRAIVAWLTLNLSTYG